MDEGIDRHVDPDPAGMGTADPLEDLLFRKICSIFPGAKPFPAYIHCIGPGRNGCPERFRGACRCEQFGKGSAGGPGTKA